ncbi:MAG TPA: HIT family protein [Mycobacteriales bacterium]|nr:HIT family protein [Mycobacteriales bacterium]
MTSHAPPGYECPFCRYVGGGEDDWVRQSHVVERTASTWTFVSPTWWANNPGHVLVVPVDHVENLYAMPDRLGGPLLGATRRAALALKAAYGCPGTSLRQHNEPAGNQDVWHYHVHVFPRYDREELYGAPSRRAEWAEMDRYAERLRPAYAQLGSGEPTAVS